MKETTPKSFVGLVASVPIALKLSPPPDPFSLLHADDLHMTIAFLGVVPQQMALLGLRAAHEKLKIAWPSGLVVEFDTVGPMTPDPRGRFRALAARVRSDFRLVPYLKPAREATQAAAGAKKDSLGDDPHVTVARSEAMLDDQLRRAATEWAARQNIAAQFVRLDGVALFERDHEGTDGRRYREIARMVL